MRFVKLISLLSLAFLIVSACCIFPAFSRANASTDSKHWVCDELPDFKLRLGGADGQGNVLDFIFDEVNLDKPIKIDEWAYLLHTVLRLPPADKESFLEMYVYNLATQDEIAREDAVGGMVKLLTIRHLSGSVNAEDLKPAEMLRDLAALSDRQETLVRLAYSEGLLDSNTITYFRPQERLSVAEAVSMLHKVILKYGITYDAVTEPGDLPGKDDLQEPVPSPDAFEKPRGLSGEIHLYRERLRQGQLQIDTMHLDSMEAVLLDAASVEAEDYLAGLNEAVSVQKWREVLQVVLAIDDDTLLDNYTYALVHGQTVPRGAAVAGMLKLLHCNGMIAGRDATDGERLAAARAFTDYDAAFDSSKLAIAYSEKLVSGYPDKTFRSGQNLSKGEALLLMLRVMERYGEPI